MSVTSRTENRIQLESESDRAGVRLDWDGQRGAWLIEAYEKDAPRLDGKFTGTLNDLWGGVSPQPRRGTNDNTTDDRSAKEQRDMSAIKAALSQSSGRAERPSVLIQRAPELDRGGTDLIGLT